MASGVENGVKEIEESQEKGTFYIYGHGTAEMLLTFFCMLILIKKAKVGT